MLDISINDIYLNNKLNLYNYRSIFNVLFKLQKKIYEASKKCHLLLVHGLQKLLISLTSIKFLAKYLTAKTLKKRNIIKVKNTFNKISNITSKSINNKELNKKILYWLLESEWNAKIDSNSLICKDIVKKIHLLHKIKYSEKVVCLHYESIIFPKLIRPEYLIAKLQSFSWINKNILITLRTEFCMHYLQSLYNPINIYNKNIHFLFGLLSNIVYIGFKWISYRQIKTNLKKYYFCKDIRITPGQILYFSQNNKELHMLKQIITDFLNNLGFYFHNNDVIHLIIIHKYLDYNFLSFHLQSYGFIKTLNLKPSVKAIKYMQRLIKNTIYIKDKLGKIKAKTNLSLKKVIYKLNKLLYIWEQYFSQIVPLSKSYLKDILYLSNEITYRWMKKKYKNSQLKTISLF
jgi:hypothetical protein